MYAKLTRLFCFQTRRENRSLAGLNEDFRNAVWAQKKRSRWVAYLLPIPLIENRYWFAKHFHVWRNAQANSSRRNHFVPFNFMTTFSNLNRIK